MRSKQENTKHLVDYGVCTHIGQRQQNQDKTLVSTVQVSRNQEGLLFAVADGMGGHSGGCLASRLACNGLANILRRKRAESHQSGPFEISRHLNEAIIRIDRGIRLKGLKDCRLEDMGSTLSCLVVTDSHSIIAHVGDTRIYRLRKGFLSILTVDHTFVQDMIFEGEVDPAETHLHPLRHVLTRAVGTGEPLQLVDCRIDPVRMEDKFLLCSDGLYNLLTDQCILDVLSYPSSSSETARELVARAAVKGLSDNSTAIVVHVQPLADFSRFQRYE